MSAVAVMTTHVAFQTGIDPHSHIGAILGRFDYFLAVFFAFSAYLLWRGMDFHRSMLVTYFQRRFWRVVPDKGFLFHNFSPLEVISAVDRKSVV